MAKSFISGRYGSVQRLLPVDASQVTEKTDYMDRWRSPSGDKNHIRQGDYAGNDGQGERTDEDPAGAASLTDDGSLLKPNDDGTYHSTVSAITSWTLENQSQPITYTASNTRGYKGKLEGTHSASGNIAGIGAVPPIAPGQRFLFYGYVGPDNGKLDNYKGTVYRVAAIANSVQIQINYQLQNPCTWTVGWQSDWQVVGDELRANRLNSDSGSSLYEWGFWDYTNMDCGNLLPSSENCFYIEGVDQPVCLLDANIQFNTETSPFTNSCSSVVGGWQSSVVGPTDCTLAANIHGNNYGDLYHPEAVAQYYGKNDDGTSKTWESLTDTQQARKFWAGSNHAVRIYVGNEGDYWEFYKMMITGFGGLNVDVTSNNPLQFSCNMEFNAYPQVANSCTPGYIIYYDGSAETSTPLVDLRPGNTTHTSELGEKGSSDPDNAGPDEWTASCPDGDSREAETDGLFGPDPTSTKKMY